MVRVTSEVGRLRQVLVHTPGEEVDNMTPSMMEQLLFDDILFGERARDEHGQFRRVLEHFDIKVVEARDLLVSALDQDASRDWLIETMGEKLPSDDRRLLLEVPAEDAADILVHGVRSEGGHDASGFFTIAPLPNWCFQRDPLVTLHDGIVVSKMATEARWREALLTRLILRFHSEFADTPIWMDPFDPNQPASQEDVMLEGGDVLVLSKDVVCVGQSARTNRKAIELLAQSLAKKEAGPRWLFMVDLPARRAYMHLDTVFTPIDKDACLVHTGVILPGSEETASVYEIDLHGDLEPKACRNLLGSLEKRGTTLTPIYCGGTDPVAQSREQWTDGANAFCLSPGLITLYDRNVRTCEELSRHGFEIIRAEDLLLGRVNCEIEAGQRVCIILRSYEMSRARGGPHCLTHPLQRDDL